MDAKKTLDGKHLLRYNALYMLGTLHTLDSHAKRLYRLYDC